MFYAENCPEEIRGQRIISWKNIISQAAQKAQILKSKEKNSPPLKRVFIPLGS